MYKFISLALLKARNNSEKERAKYDELKNKE